MQNNDFVTLKENLIHRQQQALSAIDVESLEKRAFAEGYQKAKQEDLDKVAEKIKCLDSLIKQWQSFCQDEVNSLSDSILQIISQVCQKLLQQKIQLDPNVFTTFIEALLQEHNLHSKQITLVLPEITVNLLKQKNILTDNQNIKLKVDETLKLGDLKLETDTVQIDATIASRIQEWFDTNLSEGNSK